VKGSGFSLFYFDVAGFYFDESGYLDIFARPHAQNASSVFLPAHLPVFQQ